MTGREGLGGPSNSRPRRPNEYTESPPTQATSHSDEVERMLHLLREGNNIPSILQRVSDKRSSGEYHFDRYETMQLLNLSFFQLEIRPLESNIFELLRYNDKDEGKLSVLATKICLLRQLLKEYSKPKLKRVVRIRVITINRCCPLVLSPAHGPQCGRGKY